MRFNLLKDKQMNTFGLRSINADTFNLKWHTNYVYPQAGRDVVLSLLRIHNLTLNILGYIPGISFFSGCTRMVTGLLFTATTLAIGDRNARAGIIIGHWYDEALLTGIAQIARDALEALAPFGRIINATLDITATFYNLAREFSQVPICPEECEEYLNHHRYSDPEYPLPLWPLYLA
jgi:hypothetical protein